MSTRAVIAVKTEDKTDFSGTYYHSDGMPDTLGKSLYRLFKDNKNPLQTMNTILSKEWEHIHNWSGDPADIISFTTDNENFAKADKNIIGWYEKTAANYAVYLRDSENKYSRDHVLRSLAIEYVYVLDLPYIEIYKNGTTLTLLATISIEDNEPEWSTIKEYIVTNEMLEALHDGSMLARPGDFIKSKLAGSCCGFVKNIVSKKSLGKCYIITLASGKESIIPVADAEFIAPFEWDYMG